MAKIAAYLILGIGVGLGFAYWQGLGAPDSAVGLAPTSIERASLERRLGELETALTLERFEREALADELGELRARLTEPGNLEGMLVSGTERFANTGDGSDGRGPGDERSRQRLANGTPQSREEVEQMRRQRQFESLVEAGLAPDRARYIQDREEALEMEALQARYEATQSGASREEVANLSPTSLLRAELGDADYEKYLRGLGRPTTVSVREVLPNSPAQTVGLQSGDEIVAYNGQRVFDIGELNALTNAIKPGQTVALAIERDGQPMQVYVQSGPIGISGGGRSTRR